MNVEYTMTRSVVVKQAFAEKGVRASKVYKAAARPSPLDVWATGMVHDENV